MEISMFTVSLSTELNDTVLEKLFIEFVDTIFRSMDSRLSKFKLDKITSKKLKLLFDGKYQKVYLDYRKVFDNTVQETIANSLEDILDDVNILTGNRSVSVSVPGIIVRENWEELSKITVDALSKIEVDDSNDTGDSK